MIELKNISKVYKTKQGIIQALKNVSFSLPNKGFVFVLGKSGGGKSTLLNILGCLDQPSSGEVFVNGISTKKFSEAELNSFRSKYIGFIFQEFHIIDSYTVAQNISMSIEIQNKKINKQMVDDVLNKVELKGFEKRKVKTLSGGQKQRIAIARALIKDADVVLADEPTGALDFETSKEIFEILKKLAKNKLVIVVSHDREAANRYADRIIEIKQGSIVLDINNIPISEIVEIKTDRLQFLETKSINRAINEGKQIVIRGLTLNNETISEEKEQKPFHLQKTKFTFRKALFLSFSSMKKRMVKILFSIILSTVSLTFIGFSAILSGYSGEKILLNSLQKDPVSIFNVGKMKIEVDSLIKEYRKVDFELEDYARLVQSGIDIVKKFEFSSPMRFNKYKTNAFYEENFNGFIECDDLSLLNLQIEAGRMPLMNDEIVITSYQFNAYKKYGFRQISKNDSKMWKNHAIYSFDDLENKLIYMNQIPGKPMQFLKIVGMVDIDYSKYDSLCEEIEAVNFPLQGKTKALYQEFEEIKNNYLNYVFIKKDAYQSIFMQYPIEKNLSYQFQANGCIVAGASLINRMPDFEQVNLSKYVLAPDLDVNRIGVKKIFISTRMLSELGFLEKFENRLDLSFNYYKKNTDNFADVFGKKIKITANLGTTIYPDYDFTIVGIYDSNEICVNLSEDWLNIIYYEKASSLIVPNIDNNQARKELLNKLNKTKFEEKGESFIYLDNTIYSHRINELNSLFYFATSIFPILAIVFTLFSALLIFNIISQSIHERKKDIGILKSLGANRLGVANIFIIEGAIISFINIGLAIGLSVISYQLLQIYFIDNLGVISDGFHIIRFNYLTVIIILLVSLVTAFIAIFFPILKISRKQPVDLIR